MAKDVDFTDGPILKNLIRFALPLMATMLLQTLYNVADMVIVGSFSENGSFAMGAVGACGALINLIVNTFVGLSTGVSICVAQSIGANRRQDTASYVRTAFFISLLCGIALCLFGFFASGYLLELMNTPPAVLDEAIPYMKAYFIGVPAMLIYNSMAASLRSEGDSRHPLLFLTVAGLVNVAFNIIAVVFFHTGAVGVGIATTLSQIISAILICIYMHRADISCKFTLIHPFIEKDKLSDILRLGIPSGLQNLVFSFSNTLIQATVNRFDGGAGIIVAGASAASNIENIVGSVQSSFYYTSITVIGQNIGANRHSRIPYTVRITLICATVTSVVLSALVMLFNKPLLSLYVTNDAIGESIKSAAFLQLTFFLSGKFLNACMDVGSGSLCGLGKPKLALLMTVAGACVLRLIWIFTVCAHSSDVRSLFIIYPITWFLTATAELICVKVLCRKSMKP